MDQETKIIFLEDIFKLKEQKEKELQYYKAQLIILQTKLNNIENEIRLTNLIISMIEKEQVTRVDRQKNESD